MAADQIFIVVTGIIAALLGAGALLAAARRARAGADDSPDRMESGADKYELPHADEEALAGVRYGTALRVLWWVSIAAILIGVGVTDAFGSSQPAIYLLGAAAVGVVVLTHDLLPSRLRSVPLAVLEVLAAVALLTALLTLTGYGASPFVYAFHLVTVAVALAGGGAVALGVAALATLAFLGVLWIDPALAAYGSGDFLRFGLSIGSIWLLAYVAGVFASSERRIRAAAINLSRIDPLTGLFNRGHLALTLEQEVQRTRRSDRGFCVLMIDLDGLKAVNDSYGHHRGDEVLRALGGIIRRSIRALDNAYRHGGDEFLVILPETDFVGAFVVAEKIRTGAEELGMLAGEELPTSVSIGLISCPEDGTSADELMIAADRAMYTAKSLGKNQISGNPRPRRLTYQPPEPDQPAPAPAVSAVPIGDAPTEAVSVARGVAYPPDEVVAVQAPVPPAEAFQGVTDPLSGNGHDAAEEDDLDPGEVRRHIAAARLNMDSDHQIRRAMDAFLSPTRSHGDH